MFSYPCKRLLSSLFVLLWRHSFRHSPTHSSFCSFLLICLSWFGLFINLLVDQTMISAFATILPALYSESLLFFRFCEVSAHAREHRREAKNEGGGPRRKRGWPLLFRASPISCLQSRAWSFACLARFARRTNKKERLFVVEPYPCILYLLLWLFSFLFLVFPFSAFYNSGFGVLSGKTIVLFAEKF